VPGAKSNVVVASTVISCGNIVTAVASCIPPVTELPTSADTASVAVPSFWKLNVATPGDGGVTVPKVAVTVLTVRIQPAWRFIVIPMPPPVPYSIVPDEPTAQAVFTLTAETPNRKLVVPEVCVVQVVPAFVVCSIVPVLPTTKAVFASTAETPFRLLVVPEDCAVQVVPAFVVFSITPKEPTAQAVFASTAEIPCRG